MLYALAYSVTYMESIILASSINKNFSKLRLFPVPFMLYSLPAYSHNRSVMDASDDTYVMDRSSGRCVAVDIAIMSMLRLLMMLSWSK
jgi:hypothetical protein